MAQNPRFFPLVRTLLGAASKRIGVSLLGAERRSAPLFPLFPLLPPPCDEAFPASRSSSSSSCFCSYLLPLWLPDPDPDTFCCCTCVCCWISPIDATAWLPWLNPFVINVVARYSNTYGPVCRCVGILARMIIENECEVGWERGLNVRRVFIRALRARKRFWWWWVVCVHGWLCRCGCAPP